MSLEDLDSFGPTPAPAPAPRPVPAPRPTPGPAPAPPAVSRIGWYGWFLATVFVVGMLTIFAVPVVSNHWPVPRPAPAPAPGPGPAPVPTPAYTGPLYGVYIYPDPPSPEEAALQTAMKPAVEARSGIWRPHMVSSDAVTKTVWKRLADEAGGPPVVLWFDDKTKLLRATHPANAETVLTALKEIRGK